MPEQARAQKLAEAGDYDDEYDEEYDEEYGEESLAFDQMANAPSTM